MPTRRTNVERFWSKVDRSAGPDGCWPWVAYRDPDGYGNFGVNAGVVMAPFRSVRSPRFAWELTNGPIPEGQCVLHRCDNPPCVNPAHLFLGTNADNMRDRNSKNRQANGDRNGTRVHPESAPKGERNSHAKITEADVRKIRYAFVPRGKMKEFAARFGISAASACQIRNCNTWKHVE